MDVRFTAMLRTLRHRRLRTRLSLLAIAALLWSHMLFAFHVDCVSVAMADNVAATATQHDDCAGPKAGTDRVVCQVHCSQGDSSPDSVRAPLSVPALAPTIPVFVAPVSRHASVGAPPRADAAWHRPTLHPASILLI